MNILVIGNGFDIAHGLPTSYKDFLRFVSILQDLSANLEVNPLGKVEKRMLSYLKDLKERISQKDKVALAIWTELVELVDNNVWISYFQKINVKEHWVDFEKEISKIIKTLDSARKLVEEKVSHGEEYAGIEAGQFQILCHFIGEETDDYRSVQFKPDAFTDYKEQLLTDLNRLTRCLEIYLSEFVNNLPVLFQRKDIKQINVDKVLSFNYTDTFRRVYNANAQKEIDYDFIHGKATSESNLQACNLVLGIDEYLEGKDKDLDNEFIAFKKFYQRIFKGTGNAYTKWLCTHDSYVLDIGQKNRPKMHPNVNIYFYGHSLDITDKDILKQLLTSEWVTATIFYHSKDALGSQIANLVKVIGEEELIQRTGGPSQSIVFKEITPVICPI